MFLLLLTHPAQSLTSCQDSCKVDRYPSEVRFRRVLITTPSLNLLTRQLRKDYRPFDSPSAGAGRTEAKDT